MDWRKELPRPAGIPWRLGLRGGGGQTSTKLTRSPGQSECGASGDRGVTDKGMGGRGRGGGRGATLRYATRVRCVFACAGVNWLPVDPIGMVQN